MIRQLHIAPALFLALMTLLAVAVTLMLTRHGVPHTGALSARPAFFYHG
jgi:hypothetical protein